MVKNFFTEFFSDFQERVLVPKTKPYVSFIAYRNAETVISWNTKATDRDINGNGTGTFNTATVDIQSDYFCATRITFENTVVSVPGGEGMQAVALKVAGDKAMFFRVNILGSQDTLLDISGSNYFYQCYIQVAVDFIFGSARSLSQSLGKYSRAIYSYCDFDGIILPTGWSDWGDSSRRSTVLLGEYQCRGSGANLKSHVPWAKTFSFEEARPFVDMTFIDGNEWLRL
ncbi:hypothetical protein MKX01_021343 [Papaver californicum]|nr:hypothetical protein MKX01_021343 [Papaver californicum]